MKLTIENLLLMKLTLENLVNFLNFVFKLDLSFDNSHWVAYGNNFCHYYNKKLGSYSWLTSTTKKINGMQGLTPYVQCANAELPHPVYACIYLIA